MLGTTAIPEEIVRPGGHLCAFFSGPQELEGLLLPFLRAGLTDGDRCLCLLHESNSSDVFGRARDGGEWYPSQGSPQLEIDSASRMCVQSGRFSVHEMITFIGAAAAAAARKRFPRLRFAAEMSSVLPGPPAPQAFCEYEAAIIGLVERTSASLMFLYDLERFGTPMLMDVLKTHSRVLLDGAVLYNPTYLTPQHYLTSHRRTSRENDGYIVGQEAGAVLTASDHGPSGDHQCTGLPQPPRRTMPTRDRSTTRRHDGWDTLTEAERRVTGLVATGLTNRLIAEELTLSSHTVDAHLKHVYTKLDIHSRVELTVVALRHRVRPNTANPAPPNRNRR
ncbi:MAG: hypothetical protein QOF52_2786 [Propionibacteriaceae bacterium]|nr:transcriptional regulator, LuxR family [Propionibacteriaceae bacterium]MDX6322928.1 hypothetical protein [Propionibacteriaceae bacterium]